MVKNDKNKQYSFALIAIVAIVAIVGIVMMFMNANPKLGIGLSTGASSEQESLLGAAAAKPVACTDSDGGRKYYTPGYVLYGGKTYNDACSGPNILNEKYCTAKLTQGNTQYTCPSGCKNRACIIKTTPGDLSVYPNQFLTPDKLALNVKIVVGSTAPTSHVMGAIDIAAGIQRAMGDRTLNPMPVGIAVLDIDITNPLSMNIISIGMPCVNRVSAELMGNPAICTEGFTAGQGRIISFNNNGKTQILVAGYTDTDNLATAYVLGSYDKHLLKGSECQVIVYDINTLTVNCPPVETEPVCGNGLIEGDEECEGEGKIDNCFNNYGLPSTKECNDCTWSSCGKYTGFCGDGQLVPQAEHCEGTNLGIMKSCTNLANFTGGTLACNNCRYDTSRCTPDYMCSCTMARALVEFTLSISGTNDSISDSLSLGETKTYTVGGRYYEVTAVFVSSSRTTKLQVNGVLTSELGEGDSDTLGDGVIIRITEILTACVGTGGGGMTQFTLSRSGITGLVTDYLTDGQTKTYTLGGLDYEVTAVFISSDHTVKLSVNGWLTKELGEGNSYTFADGVVIRVNNVMTTSGSSIIDFFVVRTETGQVFNQKITGGETKTYNNLLGDGKDYEITALYVDENVPANSSVIMSVNGMLTKELMPGRTQLMNGEIVIGIYSVEVCRTVACGDGILDATEECDDGNLNNGDGCDQYCNLEIYPACGNGIIEAGEQCDWTNFNNKTCTSLGFVSGVLRCTSSCTLNTSGCCGDGVRDQTYEQCDGADLGPNTCIGSGFAGGTLRCNRNCYLNTSGCVRANCTDSDGGRNYAVKGLARGMTPAGYFTNSTDYCVDSTILEEYYCNSNMVYDFRYACPYGCSDGACV
jgi:cysteine-rich repeat protein